MVGLRSLLVLATHGPISLAWAQQAMEALLALPAARRPTAVVATNDVFAVGAMQACRNAGVRIPADVSITGVGSTELGATPNSDGARLATHACESPWKP